MGHGFGELGYVRGLITYKLSPYELKPFKGIMSTSVFNMARRIRSEIFFIVPPFILGYAIYDWGKTTHHHLSRKNPKDYENDV